MVACFIRKLISALACTGNYFQHDWDLQVKLMVTEIVSDMTVILKGKDGKYHKSNDRYLKLDTEQNV